MTGLIVAIAVVFAVVFVYVIVAHGRQGRPGAGLRGHGRRHDRAVQPGPPLHDEVDPGLVGQGRAARLQALPALPGLPEVAHRGCLSPTTS